MLPTDNIEEVRAEFCVLEEIRVVDTWSVDPWRYVTPTSARSKLTMLPRASHLPVLATPYTLHKTRATKMGLLRWREMLSPLLSGGPHCSAIIITLRHTALH